MKNFINTLAFLFIVVSLNSCKQENKWLLNDSVMSYPKIIKSDEVIIKIDTTQIIKIVTILDDISYMDTLNIFRENKSIEDKASIWSLGSFNLFIKISFSSLFSFNKREIFE